MRNWTMVVLSVLAGGRKQTPFAILKSKNLLKEKLSNNTVCETDKGSIV
jgi:hypothetical protein